MGDRLSDDLPPGLYDRLVTRRLASGLAGESHARITRLDPADEPHRLARHLAEILAREIPALDADVRERVLGRMLDDLGASDERLDPPARVLRAIGRLNRAGQPEAVTIPDIPLSEHDLLVNARGEPQLAVELKKEIASADRIDLIVAFVRWYGLRLVFDDLSAARDRGAPVRLLTTTYTGSTERAALDRLVGVGATVRVSYDHKATRLHAKAWIFHRDTGYSTAYVGSSNLTRSALLDGREWNVRLSRMAAPAVFEKIAAAFESHWASSDFEPYDPERDAARLDRALRWTPRAGDAQPLSGLALVAWPYQQEMLDALEVERSVHGSFRNLVVAPTGTGKTVVAALDYRRLRRTGEAPPSLLFVAHREQILTQSRRVFREALSDGSFGELYVGGQRPTLGRQVFASIQTLHRNDPRSIDPGAFEVVIVDEFHHAEAATYRALLDHLRPRVLLALTATPERADGLDIRQWTDGRTAFDMRLWHALDRQLLAPFQYFGLADTADLSTVRWQAGRYHAGDLDRVFTGDHKRAALVLAQVRRVIAEPGRMRALGFCASVAHAELMAERFTASGLPAVAVSGATPEVERSRQIQRLVEGELCAIFTRDVFNEGIDIPTLDTILLLRPTESVTVFLQQIGRGLRRHAEKDVCTVLDFVANYRREFRFDLRLRALTGLARRELPEAAESGFPFLPSGCHIDLERQARDWIVGHLKQAVVFNRRALVSELRLVVLERGKAPGLADFLAESGAEIEDVGGAGGWCALRRDAGQEARPQGPDEAHLARGVRRLYHLDDVERIERLRRWVAGDEPLAPGPIRDRRGLWMALLLLWSVRRAPERFEEAAMRLWRCPAVLDELRESLPILKQRIARSSTPLPDPDVPLRIGASYARDEILAAFGRLRPGERYSHQAGPWWHEPTRTEVLFVTLRKTERDYSPQTMYRDFAISPDLFHWESQHTTAASSAAGKRYLDQRTNGVRILLAVREARKDPWGATAPYVLLGPADYAEHRGERPIAITWHLRSPIPVELFERFRAAAA